MVDMTQYSSSDSKLARHCLAIRENQVSVAFMILYLNGYDIEVRGVDTPNAGAAKECLDELGYDSVNIWSCSTKAGGIWTTAQRNMLKTGEA